MRVRMVRSGRAGVSAPASVDREVSTNVMISSSTSEGRSASGWVVDVVGFAALPESADEPQAESATSAHGSSTRARRAGRSRRNGEEVAVTPPTLGGGR